MTSVALPFELSFDSGVLAGLSYALEPDAKMGFALDPGNDFSGGFSPGLLDAFSLADVSLDHDALKALQGESLSWRESALPPSPMA